jgi:hypothetical protein
MRTTIIILALALVAVAVIRYAFPSKQNQCERAFDQMKQLTLAIGKGLDGKSDELDKLESEFDAKRHEFVGECKTWPQDVVDCLAKLMNMPDSCEQTLDERNLEKLHIKKIW